jgi:proline racemase
VAGLPAIIPTVTGRAWIMGEATWVLDPNDPFPNGFIA